MLVLPLYGICTLALTSIFFPWIKALQQPSIALFNSASAISQDCFKDFSDWIHLSTGGSVHRLSPLSSHPQSVHLPTPSSNSSIWHGPTGFIILPRGSSLATVTQHENSLSLVTPFKVHALHFPPPLSTHESGREVDNEADEAFDPEELITSNDGSPLFLGLVFSLLVAFYLVVCVSWKRDLAKLDPQAEEAKVMRSESMEELSRAKIVLGKTEAEDSYLEGVLDGLDTASKPETSSSSRSSEVHINILEHLYIEGDSPSVPAPAPALFSVKRWTMPKSEFESIYGTVPCVPPSVEPSTAVPPVPIEEHSKRKRSDSDSGSGSEDKGPEERKKVHFSTRQSDNGGRLTMAHGTDRISTAVLNLHVKRPLVRKRPFVHVSVRRPKRPRGPSTRLILLDRTVAPAVVDIHAGGLSDTQRENISTPSTAVNIRTECDSDRNIEHPPTSNPSEPVMSLVPAAETVEPLTLVDTHLDSAFVALAASTGSQPDPSTIESGRDDGSDSSTSVRTTVPAPRPLSATAPAPARVEVLSSPQTESPQPRRRRRNRMGQRQRRRLREMRENGGWEAVVVE